VKIPGLPPELEDLLDRLRRRGIPVSPLEMIWSIDRYLSEDPARELDPEPRLRPPPAPAASRAYGFAA